MIALVVVAIAVYVLHYTRFGRNVYAIGGNEQSALLMGLPVGRTKVAVYTISGFCSALGGVLFALLHALRLQPAARSAWSWTRSPRWSSAAPCSPAATATCVGTVLGVLVLGLIQTIITFEGTLSSWWTKIVIGALLLVFILLQRAIITQRTRRVKQAVTST